MASGEVAGVRPLSRRRPDLHADRVSGAPASLADGIVQHALEVARTSHADEAAHRALGVAGSGVDQNGSDLLVRVVGDVKAFAQSRRAVSALEGELVHQDV